MRNYTYKFTGTATVRAASAAIALREVALDMPPGASLELIAESEGAPTAMPELPRIETVLAPAPMMTPEEHNAGYLGNRSGQGLIL